MNLVNIYNSLLSCDKSFFSSLNEQEFSICDKIADYFFGQKVNIGNEDLVLIQARIDQFKQKKWKPGQTQLTEAALQAIYKKFHPERKTIADLPVEILLDILLEVAEFQIGQVCQSWATLSKDHIIWKKIAEKINYRPFGLRISLGQWHAEVKKHCRQYAENLQGWFEITPEIKKLLEGEMTTEKMLQLMEWHEQQSKMAQQRGRIARRDGVPLKYL